MNVTEFLRARIDDDEELACRGAPRVEPSNRLLAECAAKRRIVERWNELDGNDPEWGRMDDQTAGQRAEWEDTLCALASVYADHPDYNPAWSIDASASP
jgi:hypothetical protein